MNRYIAFRNCINIISLAFFIAYELLECSVQAGTFFLDGTIRRLNASNSKICASPYVRAARRAG